ncbi:MAG: hypothetical protein ACRCXL_00330 [Dermatophilaceae bacterium]
MSRWDDDDALAGDLADAVGGDREIPAQWRDAARGAFAWRTVEDDLLRLADDGALVGAAVRGAAEPRVLSFGGADLTLEIEVNEQRILGQVLPPRACVLTMESPQQPPRSTSTDGSGLFVLDRTDQGAVRFGVETEGAIRCTEWVLL